MSPVSRPAFAGNRVVRHTGSRYPILQSPMSWIARAPLVSAVSAAGAMGVLETSSGFPVVAEEYAAIRAATDQPFAINIAIKFIKDRPEVERAVLDWALDGRVGFVTTSAGDPRRHVQRIKDAGVIVYHQVATLEGALKAQDAGVDGLVVEGGESGGVRGADAVHSFALLQAVRERVDLPIVAAGGIVDGRGMAAAFALGAEGVAMGTRFVCSAESPVHVNYKQGIVDAGASGSLTVPMGGRAIIRVLRNDLSEGIASGRVEPLHPQSSIDNLYVGGDLGKAMGSAGESAGLIHAILPAAQIVEDTVAGFWREIERLSGLLHGQTQSDRTLGDRAAAG
ncbi:NAD(P)H-dependent flavin oxidoreductase [Zavarzinia sp. CC-PAN008]|uniref:NAD(P)H-dependent flavin oxidoreductase n=1 Tax=Zavarzinia sp. CC-PAN008 TaxID=3243332 RepID=UPI003F7426CD